MGVQKMYYPEKTIILYVYFNQISIIAKIKRRIFVDLLTYHSCNSSDYTS